MHSIIYLAILFIAKVIDNAINTTKTIMIQRSRWVLAMKNLRDFLAEHHITNVAADSYTLDWNTKTITITAYPETKAESRLINEYIEKSQMKFKRVVQPG